MLVFTLDSTELDTRVYSVETLPTLVEIKRASNGLKGFLWAGQYYVVHNSCDGKSVYWILASEVPDIVSAREICGRMVEHPKWTYSSMARQLTNDYIRHRSERVSPRLLIPDWHYQECWPIEAERAIMYDLHSAYWQMASRAPSPDFTICGDTIVWLSLDRETRRRWDNLRVLIEPHKKLRLAMAGVNASGWKNRFTSSKHAVCYRNGARYDATAPHGKLQSISLLSVRCVYEVTQIQSEIADTVLSNGDCVVTTHGTDMEYWHELGLEYNVKADGPADIIDLQTYKIGNKQSDPYTYGLPPGVIAQYYRPTYPKKLEYTGWHKQLLRLKE